LDAVATAGSVSCSARDVEEGGLLEAPTPAATGTERRAFGEFVGPRGELASYAFGWATDVDPPFGRMTLGIGAGNPGAGRFMPWFSRMMKDTHSDSLTSRSSGCRRVGRT